LQKVRRHKVQKAALLHFQEHGAASAAAADRAEERLANVDVGSFAYWKNIESFIHAAIAPQLSFSSPNLK
jgi:hypothetical protein